MVKQQIKKLIKAIGTPVFKKELQALHSIAVAYQRMIENYEQNQEVQNSSCEGIVFSKDRAMQLHALLSSYFAYVKNPVPLYVLYTYSNRAHADSYEELKKIFLGKDVFFIEEKGFKNDLEALLERISSTMLFFMTDDGLFIDSFDMHEVMVFNPIYVLPSLIKGKDLTYCYIHNKYQQLPEFIRPDDFTLPKHMICWEWGKAEKDSDWAYPMSLDLTFYSKTEMATLIKNVWYKAPNSLETALHFNYVSIFKQRKGVCYEKAKYVNIVCNIVNTEHKNRHTDLHSADSLLTKWQAGYRIQYELFYGKTCDEAETSPFAFVKR
jgi:hypothetical protein